jgi:hypothetical protein
MRYVGRTSAHEGDLTGPEVALIRKSGLALGIVQHVESDTSWLPTGEKGMQYGTMAAFQCAALGIAKRTTVWLDLEAVAPKTPRDMILAYCNTWSRIIRSSGYQPGLYVGWHCGLTPRQLFQNLSISRYWAAYNLNKDEYPAVRGVCMRQHAALHANKPIGIDFEIDTNTVHADALGGLPSFDAPVGDFLALNATK